MKGRVLPSPKRVRVLATWVSASDSSRATVEMICGDDIRREAERREATRDDLSLQNNTARKRVEKSQPNGLYRGVRRGCGQQSGVRRRPALLTWRLRRPSLRRRTHRWSISVASVM